MDDTSPIVEHFRRMAANNRWCNDRLYRAVLSLEAGEFEAERTGFFPSLKETLNHILSIDRYYIDALEQGGLGPAAFHDFLPYDDPSALAAAQRAEDERLIAFCRKLKEMDMARRVITDRGNAGKFHECIDALLAHLFLHQIHHRGQAHAMLSGTSVKPPQLDEFFLDFDIPLRKEEMQKLGLGSDAGEQP